MLFCYWHKKTRHLQFFLSLFGGTLFEIIIIKEKTLLIYHFTVMLVKIFKFELSAVIVGKNVYFGAFLNFFSK